MATIRLVGLTKRFGDVVAIQDVNLQANDGELLVLMGPSGCGKSVILRLIAGLEEPSEGEIWIGERRVDKLAPKDRDVAILFPNDALDCQMTVYENIAVSLELRNVAREDIEPRVHHAAEMVDIVELLPRPARRLSKAQRIQAALARALAPEPAALLMDDLLSNLQAKARTRTRAELVNRLHQAGLTAIYTTHDSPEALAMGDRVAVMEAGRIQQIQTT